MRRSNIGDWCIRAASGNQKAAKAAAAAASVYYHRESCVAFNREKAQARNIQY